MSLLYRQCTVHYGSLSILTKSSPFGNLVPKTQLVLVLKLNKFSQRYLTARVVYIRLLPGLAHSASTLVGAYLRFDAQHLSTIRFQEAVQQIKFFLRLLQANSVEQCYCRVYLDQIGSIQIMTTVFLYFTSHFVKNFLKIQRLKTDINNIYRQSSIFSPIIKSLFQLPVFKYGLF